METLAADLPGLAGAHWTKQDNIASVASNGADTAYQSLFRLPSAGNVEAVHWFASASQAGATNHTRTLQLMNLGSAGAGTTVVASYTVTASIAANVAQALAVTAANKAITAGDILAFNTVSVGNGVAIVAGHFCVQFE